MLSPCVCLSPRVPRRAATAELVLCSSVCVCVMRSWYFPRNCILSERFTQHGAKCNAMRCVRAYVFWALPLLYTLSLAVCKCVTDFGGYCCRVEQRAFFLCLMRPASVVMHLRNNCIFPGTRSGEAWMGGMENKNSIQFGVDNLLCGTNVLSAVLYNV